MNARWTRLDDRRVEVGGKSVPLRFVIVAVAAIVWIATIAFATGASIVPAAATAFAFLIPLTAISLVSRTVGFRLQLSFFLWGGFMLACALLAIDLFGLVDARNDTLRNYVVPLLEELAKLVPLLLFLLIRRRDRAWTLGAADILVLAATTGAAFGFVEDAYLRHASSWSEGYAWLPVTSLVDFKERLVAGHAIWAGISGGALGLAILWRSRPRIALPLAVVGFLWSWLDHAANNQLAIGGRDGSNVVVSVWRTIEGNGFFSVYLFIGLVALAVIADRWALRSAGPLAAPALPPSTAILERWRWIRARRALAFAAWQLRGYGKGPAPTPLVQLRTILSGATIGSLGLLLVAIAAFSASGALLVLRLLPSGPGILGWLHDVGANVGDQGIPGGAAIGVGAGALSLGGPGGSDPQAPGPPLPPEKGGPPAQTVSRFPPAQFPPVPPTVWTKVNNWINDELSEPKGLANVSIGRRMETEAAHSEEEVHKPHDTPKTNI